MNIFRALIVILSSIVVVSLVYKNLNTWALRFRAYMIKHEKSVRGYSGTWHKPWTLILSKVMIIFFAIMFIIFIYVTCFS